MQRIEHFCALLILGLVCGCGTTNTSNPPASSASTAFIHSYSKFSFPESVGTFRRVEVQKYDKAGRDVGVGYNSPLPVIATVFVYPGPGDVAILPAPKLDEVSKGILDAHFEASKREIQGVHTDARLISEGSCRLVQGQNHFDGKKAVFSLGYKFGFQSQPSLSEVYVFLLEPGVKFLATERQFVKYRITYPVAKQAQAEAEVVSFMNELAWPTK